MQVTGNVTSPRNVSGSVVLGAVQVSGLVSPSREISGGIALGAVEISGDLQAQFPETGHLRVGPACNVPLEILP